MEACRPMSKQASVHVTIMTHVGTIKDSSKAMGDIDVNRNVRKIVFVTVGTTCFDALVRAVDSEEVRTILLNKGYTDLLIQLGRGSFRPSKVLNLPFIRYWLYSMLIFLMVGHIFLSLLMVIFSVQSAGDNGSLVVDYFTFSPSIADHLRSASLVISHAGINT
ncbi:hypothetical protein EJ110_NYTH22976 [Nymphaea thermarum]|nr:hypothetical protein EJ110_NYTH22976 [Nymphaea thermarum]